LQRVADLMDRLRDQILLPMRDHRDRPDGSVGHGAAERDGISPHASVNVNPLTRQLQRRLQAAEACSI